MSVKRHTVTITTDGLGAGTDYTPVFSGRIFEVVYVKPGSGNYDNGVTFAVTLDGTGESLWGETAVNASKTVRPVVAATLPSGAASTLSEGPFVAANDRVKIAVTAGGAAKVGTFHVTAEGEWGGLDR